MMAVALHLQAQARVWQELETYHALDAEPIIKTSWETRIVVPWFPYVNAAVVYLSTVLPSQRKFMGMIEPIFSAFFKAEDVLLVTVQEFGHFVDGTIDGLQKDFHVMMKPIKPKLDLLQKQAALAEKILEQADVTTDLDISDPSDIDRELDEAQGLVGKQLKEAEEHLKFQSYVPNYLDSPKQFYWQIVFPILLLFLALQLGVAYLADNYRLTGPLLPIWQHDNTANNQGMEHNRYLRHTHKNNSLRGPLKELEQHVEKNATYHSNQTTVVDEFMPTTSRPPISQNISDQLHGYKEKVTDELKGKYQAEFEQAVVESKSFMYDVLWSYIVVVFQTLAVYFITSDTVQLWFIRQGMQHVEKGAKQTMKEYGVTDAMDNVFGDRLDRIHDKVMKLLRLHKKIQNFLDEYADLIPDGIEEKAGAAIDQIQDTVGGLFGKFLGR